MFRIVLSRRNLLGYCTCFFSVDNISCITIVLILILPSFTVYSNRFLSYAASGSRTNRIYCCLFFAVIFQSLSAVVFLWLMDQYVCFFLFFIYCSNLSSHCRYLKILIPSFFFRDGTVCVFWLCSFCLDHLSMFSINIKLTICFGQTLLKIFFIGPFCILKSGNIFMSKKSVWLFSTKSFARIVSAKVSSRRSNKKQTRYIVLYEVLSSSVRYLLRGYVTGSYCITHK